MIYEIIVVEGRGDEDAVKKAAECETILLSGFGTSREIFSRIDKAYEKQGIIILTDPDYAGEKIRARLAKRYPMAKHAFISREEGMKKGDIGVENASAQAIRKALEGARCGLREENRPPVFSMKDLAAEGLLGTPAASEKRDKLGAVLGIGYGNAKTFLKRLNHYGITRREWQEGLQKLKAPKEPKEGKALNKTDEKEADK